MNIKSENGSYMVEACISLLFFLMVIYLIFMQVNTMIVESVLQKSVDNYAMEISSYSYILKRANLIIEHDDNELTSTQSAINSGKQLFSDARATYDDLFAGGDDLGSLIEGLYSNPGKISSDVNTIGSSLKAFIEAIKGIDWKKDGIDLGRYAAESAVKIGINNALSAYCDNKTRDGAYLPKNYSDFCKAYYIMDNNIEYKVKFMPDDKNNTVFISVKCKIDVPFTIPGFDSRTVVKTAYSPLWV